MWRGVNPDYYNIVDNFLLRDFKEISTGVCVISIIDISRLM